MTIFQKIIDKEIPADIVYEDDHTLAFRDIQPVAPVHVLVIPKRAVMSLHELTDTDIGGRLLATVREVAHLEGLEEGGYRVVTNIGDDGGQSVPHLHFHVIGGRKLSWPPG
jgi:histidine triad (HIT) family protein